jgi:hypothetical protein
MADRRLAWILSGARLSAVRAFVLPVRRLEGLRGAAARTRVELLLRGWRGAQWNLIGACGLLEAGLLIALSFGSWQFIPAELQGSFRSLPEELGHSGWLQHGLRLAELLAIGLVEPVFVAAGFAMYLSRRTDLEAWDIELAFRRLRNRLAPDEQAA